ncbi:MAG: LuxR C-terminal-related transcriptional regulator [Cognatishimia sp.]
MKVSDIAYQQAPIGLCVLENRRIRSPNDAFAKMFGTTLEACNGTSIADFYASKEDFEAFGARVRVALEADGQHLDERIMKRADGTLFWCRVRGKSLSPDNPFYCGVWTFADLSDERPVVALTQREREIAILTCRGKTSKEIGLDLNLSYRTIEEYRARLLKKFGAKKLAELVAKLSGMPL